MSQLVGRWLAVGSIFAVTGCTAVKPWERGTLSDPLMDRGRDPLGLAMAEHMYFSREATMGGEGVGGGGCGCN